MFCASASQQSTGKSTFNLVSASKVPSAMALPAMSSCMPSMCFAGFRLWPPVSKQMPLPTSASAELFEPAFALSIGDVNKEAQRKKKEIVVFFFFFFFVLLFFCFFLCFFFFFFFFFCFFCCCFLSFFYLSSK